MVNSLVILKKGAEENHEKEVMYKDYLENIIKGAYIAKLMSKKFAFLSFLLAPPISNQPIIGNVENIRKA